MNEERGDVQPAARLGPAPMGPVSTRSFFTAPLSRPPSRRGAGRAGGRSAAASAPPYARPYTGSAAPVTALASGEVRKRTTCPISSGFTHRRGRHPPSPPCLRGVDDAGQDVPTVTPSCFTSSEAAATRAISPAFDAA